MLTSLANICDLVSLYFDHDVAITGAQLQHAAEEKITSEQGILYRQHEEVAQIEVRY